MAKLLYGYWFVQFDFPDENSHPYKSSGGKMVWNEKLKREIPEGWEVAPLNEWLEIKSGFAFKSETYESTGQYKVITIKNVQDHYLDTTNCDYLSQEPEGFKEWCRLTVGDRLISLTGNCGRLCIVTETNLLLNQRVGLLSCDESLKEYAYWLLSSEEYQKNCQNLANGAAQANLSPIDVCKLYAVRPASNILNAYNEILEIQTQLYINNEIEVRSLTKQLDELLPLLMNGQASVNSDLSDMIKHIIQRPAFNSSIRAILPPTLKFIFWNPISRTFTFIAFLTCQLNIAWVICSIIFQGYNVIKILQIEGIHYAC